MKGVLNFLFPNAGEVVEEGKQGFRDGLKHSCNPYPPWWKRHWLWAEGYSLANMEHIEEQVKELKRKEAIMNVALDSVQREVVILTKERRLLQSIGKTRK